MNFKELLATITTSRHLLPAACAYSLFLMLCYGVFSKGLFGQACCLAVAAYLMVLLNNTYSLIRIYSRMVSSTFLILSMMCPFLAGSMHGNITTILFVAFYYLFFKTYQDHHAPGTAMYAFACLGIISTQFIQITFLLPVVMPLLYTRMLAGNTKTLIAAFMGYLLPYWIWTGLALWQGNIAELGAHLAGIIDFDLSFHMPELHVLLTLLALLALVIISTIQCLNDSAADKIKTRMIYDVFIWVDVFAMAFLLLQPQHSDYMMRIIIISSSPLIAHYFTLSENNRITPYVFAATVVSVLMLTVYNLWM